MTVPQSALLIPQWFNTRLQSLHFLGSASLGKLETGLWILAGVLGFHAAYITPAGGSWMILTYLSLVQLTRLEPGRRSFLTGLTFGLLLVAPQLSFFFNIFSIAAVPLWLVLSFWTGLFIWLGSHLRREFPAWAFVLALPSVWMGLEYFRSELYYLRFAWLNAGFTMGPYLPGGLLQVFGVHGFGFMLMLLACLLSLLRRDAMLVVAAVVMLAFSLCTKDWSAGVKPRNRIPAGSLVVAGVQMEFPTEGEVLRGLDQALLKYPDASLIMLSEYTFHGPVPESVRAWCKARGKYLVAGGRAEAEKEDYYNTAFVIGPTGEAVFQQANCVPIQFFQDGLPAPKQALWESPWGRLGICICYDLSFSRVTDELVRQGAQGILVPTMDVITWGEHQHELHARVAPVRAMEYGVPIFRVASSGISQLIDARGRTLSSASTPGDGEIFGGRMSLAAQSSLPVDRHLAPAASAATPLIGLLALLRSRRKQKLAKPEL
jgi:apolipoprotein N-acyltransferase